MIIIIIPYTYIDFIFVYVFILEWSWHAYCSQGADQIANVFIGMASGTVL